MTIKKAVFAVAGFGTRFLPATKVLPKELIPLVDRPIIQHLVEETVAAGVEDIIFVLRPGSQGIADHFDSSRELELHLEAQGKKELLALIKELPQKANFAVVRQARHLPYGNGTPLLAARRFLDKDEPFVFLFGDDLVLSKVPCVKQLVETFEKHTPAAVVGVQEVSADEVSRYGIVKTKPGREPLEMELIVEKPKREEAPSRLAQFGRFVLTPRIVEILQTTALGKGNELYLADALAKLCREARVLVQPVEGRWYTTGDPLNFLQATVAYALAHPEYGRPFADFLRSLDLGRPS